MTCRHRKGDPNCSSTPGGIAWQREQDYRTKTATEASEGKAREAEARVEELLSRTPNPDRFKIVRHHESCGNLILEVQYSECSACTFDARKVMVFLGSTIGDALYWQRIDPHFADGDPADPTHSPAPRARFPADDAGWADAIEFAGRKRGQS